ncbi:MAG: SH3 domain-containing protein [Woeseia sp.]
MSSRRLHVLAAASFVLAGAALHASEAYVVPAHGVIGVENTQLTPEFWIAKLEHPDEVVLERAAIETQNAKLMQLDPSMHDLQALPATLTHERVAAWVEELAERPAKTLYDVTGEPVSHAALDAVVDNRNLDAIPGQQSTRYGLVVRRADLRTFPTALRVFRSPGDTDIDRFQESALFPGTPIVIAHESRDERWWFVVSPRYAAWIEKQYVAEGAAAEVFGYRDKSPYRIVTGATVDTVFSPEEPALSELQLDMGVRVPVLADRPAGEPVNGQHPYASYVIELPMRAEEGGLRLAPVLLQRTADTAGEYLPLTRANIIRQGFKFLGERYGWGHSYNGRDCSGFVSEVYRSMGVQMPRNTSAQSVSPALHKRQFDAADERSARMAAIGSLDVGDLVYIPGHVMMVVGRVDGEPWVIHDTTGISYRTPEGSMARVDLNAVSVTPLMPLKFNENESYVDRMTSIVRIHFNSAREAPPPP